MNKLLIIEGTDNSGKDLLISKFLKNYNNTVEVVHFDRPRSHNDKDAREEQNEKFTSFCKLFENDLNNRLVICNRAWYGEYIYGTMYRGRTEDDVQEMIDKCENILKNTDTDVTFILLYADPAFLEKNDDGQSLSEGKKDIIEIEAELFKKVFERSNIDKKLLIEVTKDGNFINEWDIYNEVNNLMNS